MSSVSPSSSASNEALPSSVLGFDVVACFNEIRAMADSGYLSSNDAAALARQVFPAYHAGLRKLGESPVGSEVSSSSCGVEQAGKGSKASSASSAKYRGLLQLKSWRASGNAKACKTVGRGTFVDVDKPGFCYLKAINPRDREEVAHSLGKNPTAYSLMALRQDKILPLQELERLDLRLASGVAHVEFGGESRFLSAFAHLSNVSRPALRHDHTFWHVLNQLPAKSIPGFFGSTLVGLETKVKSIKLLFSSHTSARMKWYDFIREKMLDWSSWVPAYKKCVLNPSDQVLISASSLPLHLSERVALAQMKNVFSSVGFRELTETAGEVVYSFEGCIPDPYSVEFVDEAVLHFNKDILVRSAESQTFVTSGTVVKFCGEVCVLNYRSGAIEIMTSRYVDRCYDSATGVDVAFWLALLHEMQSSTGEIEYLHQLASVPYKVLI